MSCSITGEFSAIGGNQLSAGVAGVPRRVSLTLVANGRNFNRISLSRFFHKRYVLCVIISKHQNLKFYRIIVSFILSVFAYLFKRFALLFKLIMQLLRYLVSLITDAKCEIQFAIY